MATRKTQLRIVSGNGIVTRDVLNTPLRDAAPSELPIIDVSGIFSAAQADRQAVADQIRAAATSTGFFYIANHGIPAPVTDAACSASLDFFRQPAELKEPANARHSRANQFKVGWKPPQSQHINPFESVDRRESFSWVYHAAHDPSVDGAADIPPKVAAFLHSDADGFPWTAAPPQLGAALIPCWQAVLGLGRALVRSMALALGLDEHAFDAKFTHPDAAMAVNYYRPLRPSAAEGVSDVSIGSHTDFQLFTILWQDAAGGLQVLSREGQWLRAAPVPGAFVVNFGDYMQRITNDRFLSTVHRVQNRSGRERLSMAFFFGFNLDESCAVLDTCVAPGEEKRYDEVGCYEWMQRRLRAMQVDLGAGKVAT
ncbi:2og-Fe oxygenase family protein [Lasiosphaeria miniovina]|uniref:2og-Fe oxygenase family protein n=1 Tax=Lasiosphaeria miniovina TaxID=1954250 RepID=A0AA40AD11_9PEZI|nr:2og-Fe oxygenase family protein [Lasiosphaeria miniovina]KAK0713633.1 2og-Fe oxygenase family protein [Lasiosphaeria miniovina]